MAETHLAEEMMIVGHILHAPEKCGGIFEALRAADFESEPLAEIYSAAAELFAEGAPLNLTTVRGRANPDAVDGIYAKTAELTSSEVGWYVRAIADAAKLRRVTATAFRLSQCTDIESAGHDIDELNAALIDTRSVQVVSAGRGVRDFIERQCPDAPEPEYIRLGMWNLDSRLYIEPGDFVVVGGYPSAGKTLLSLQFAQRVAQSYKVGYFSLETNPDKIIDRLMSQMSAVPLTRIKTRTVVGDDRKRLADAAKQLASLKLDIIRAGGMTVRDIRALTLSRRYEVVFVDYLQIVEAGGKSRYEQVTQISRDLHALSQSSGVTVIALAQLSRPEKQGNKPPPPPSMASLRESGQIEQDADAILLLWPNNPNDNRCDRTLKIAKNKEGERAKINLKFAGATQRMFPTAWQEGQEGSREERPDPPKKEVKAAPLPRTRPDPMDKLIEYEQMVIASKRGLPF